MRILVFNCGSSSLKFELLELEPDNGVRRTLAQGVFEQIGAHTHAVMRANGHEDASSIAIEHHAAAAMHALTWLDQIGDGQPPDVVVHRIVHGGDEVTAPAIAAAEVIRALEHASRFAPLHNPPALATLDAVSRRIAGVTAVVVPDTAFHHTLPDYARTYAIPAELTARHGIRRFGFHGIGHAWMMERYAEIRGLPAQQLRLITLQLGAGCSAAAIDRGRSVDTSMGLTPLQGLMMATRSGDLDPSIPGFIARAEHISTEQVEGILNEKSGLLGVSGRSADMRELLSAATDESTTLALSMFAYQVRKYIGAYLAVLGGADAILFGGGIGEHSAPTRARILSGLEPLGIAVDARRNGDATERDACISAQDSAIAVHVIALDEELYMARAAARLICARSGQ